MINNKFILLFLAVVFYFASLNYDANIELSKTKVIKINDINIKKVNVIAVGDIMFHTPQIKNAYDGKGYDFRSVFSEIKPEIAKADIAIGNYEAVTLPSRKSSGFPKFNVPQETLDSIKYAGFDVLSIANNHIMDWGQAGLISTEALIKKKGMVPIGAGEAREKKYAIITKNGIRVAFLPYTFGTNGLIAEKGTLKYINIEEIGRDIREVKKLSDFIIVYLHSGTEYVRDIEESQRKLYEKIADLGADCILNSHPHVAKDSELYYTNGRKVLINYSMGNFLSNQNDKYTDIGLMVKFDIEKIGKATKMLGYEILPVYRLRYNIDTKIGYRIVLCSEIDRYCDKIDNNMISYVKDLNNKFTLPEVYEVFNGK